MMKMLTRHILSFLSLLCLTAVNQAPLQASSTMSSAEGPPSTDAMLSEWDDVFGAREDYQHRRALSIDSLKMVAHAMDTADVELRSEALRTVAKAYAGFNVDSSLHYFDIAAEASRLLPGMHNIIKAESCLELAICDVVGSAIDRFEAVDQSLITNPKCRISYHIAAFHLFSNIGANAKSDSTRLEAYRARDLARDSLLARLPDDSPVFHYLTALKNESENKIHMAIASCQTAMLLLTPDELFYPPVAATLSRLYNRLGRHDEELKYIIKAAESQIMRGDTYRGYTLGIAKELYRLGEHERARNSLATTLDDALKAGAIVSAMNVADSYHNMGRDYASQIDIRNHQLTAVLVTVVVLCVVSCCIWGVVEYRRGRRYREARCVTTPDPDIQSADSVPSPVQPSPSSQPVVPSANYILDLLQLCDNCMERLESFQRLAKRKISAGQVEDLYRMLVSGRIGTEQSQTFFDIFDNTFINLYPSFVDDVNKLLKPDRRIEPDENRHLNNELRIYALMRLGIEDGQRVARLLGVSVSTVYTYRNKMRLRAIDRDTFEDKVRAISPSA